jgi:hypothetical protein
VRVGSTKRHTFAGGHRVGTDAGQPEPLDRGGLPAVPIGRPIVLRSTEPDTDLNELAELGGNRRLPGPGTPQELSGNNGMAPSASSGAPEPPPGEGTGRPAGEQSQRDFPLAMQQAVRRWEVVLRTREIGPERRRQRPLLIDALWSRRSRSMMGHREHV